MLQTFIGAVFRVAQRPRVRAIALPERFVVEVAQGNQKN